MRRAARSSVNASAHSPDRYAAIPTASRTTGSRPPIRRAARACSRVLVDQPGCGRKLGTHAFGDRRGQATQLLADLFVEFPHIDVVGHRRVRDRRTPPAAATLACVSVTGRAGTPLTAGAARTIGAATFRAAVLWTTAVAMSAVAAAAVLTTPIGPTSVGTSPILAASVVAAGPASGSSIGHLPLR
jgi:hypothetical protein